jgi:hypothetical protein
MRRRRTETRRYASSWVMRPTVCAAPRSRSRAVSLAPKDGNAKLHDPGRQRRCHPLGFGRTEARIMTGHLSGHVGHLSGRTNSPLKGVVRQLSGRSGLRVGSEQCRDAVTTEGNRQCVISPAETCVIGCADDRGSSARFGCSSPGYIGPPSAVPERERSWRGRRGPSTHSPPH